MLETHQENLLARVIQVMTQNGWLIASASDIGFPSFGLHTHRDEQELRLEVNVGDEANGAWFGLVNVSRFVWKDIWGCVGARGSYRTLLIGKKKRKDVFLSLLPLGEQAQTRKDLYLDVKWEDLNLGYLNNLHVWRTQDNDLGVAIRDTFFPTFAEQLESLVHVSDSAQAIAFLQQATLHPNDSDLLNGDLPLKRRKQIKTILATWQENRFREEVLKQYRNQCAFCSRGVPSVQATRLVPVGHVMSAPNVRNGLALCALHRHAFEQGIITIDEKLRIVSRIDWMDNLSESKHHDGHSRKRLLHSMICPDDPNARPSTEYIRLANRIRGWP
jgi:hypothetical protein